MKLVTNKLKSGGLHEKHVVATWNLEEEGGGGEGGGGEGGGGEGGGFQ